MLLALWAAAYCCLYIAELNHIKLNIVGSEVYIYIVRRAKLASRLCQTISKIVALVVVFLFYRCQLIKSSPKKEKLNQRTRMAKTHWYCHAERRLAHISQEIAEKVHAGSERYQKTQCITHCFVWSNVATVNLRCPRWPMSIVGSSYNGHMNFWTEPQRYGEGDLVW